MIFGIDIKAATGFQRSGIGNYVFNLVENLNVIDNQNQYYLLNPNENSRNPFHLKKNFRIRNRYSLLNFINRFDVVHGPDFKIPFANAKKKVVNIHDLASFVNDGFMSKDFAELTKKKVLTSIKKADRILTISNAIKDQLESEYPETKGKITNIYLGVDKNIQHISDIEKRESTRKKYNLPESFILFVGNLESRKNILTLLKAFSKLIQESGFNHQLVLVGKPGFGFELIKKYIDENNLFNKIKLIGWVDEGDLYTIYSLAELFVFPTFYEGFGLPIIEAMKCKLPVLLSDIVTNKEIAQDAASYFNTSDENDLAEQILKLVNDNVRKEEMIKKGCERSQKFDWRKTATETLSIYENLSR